MEFILCPAGTFMMGATRVWKYRGVGGGDMINDKPVHQVRLTRPFYIGKYLVTQTQWREVMGNTPSRFKGGEHPVEQISWNNVQEFVKKLNETEGHKRYRLPTEAEWEYAARSGTTTEFFWGEDENKLDEYAWFDSEKSTHPVGQKMANPWGLHDVYGNLCEWVQDWYGETYYANSLETDPPGPAAGTDRVVRGGCWYDPAGYCRSAVRCHYAPDIWFCNIGFRLALSPE